MSLRTYGPMYVIGNFTNVPAPLGEDVQLPVLGRDHRHRRPRTTWEFHLKGEMTLERAHVYGPHDILGL